MVSLETNPFNQIGINQAYQQYNILKFYHLSNKYPKCNVHSIPDVHRTHALKGHDHTIPCSFLFS